MPTSGKEDEFRIGFLAAIEVPERGYVGGLLVTNRFGRPLEFQCTTPVKPNRTQEILYGPTLTPFVLGELIGRTLVEKIGVKPHLVLTEVPEILEVRNHVSLPVACLDDDDDVPPTNGDAAAEPSSNERDAGVEQDSTIIEPAESEDEPVSPPQVVEAANRHNEPQDQPCATTGSQCDHREADSTAPSPLETTTAVATDNGASVEATCDPPAVMAAAPAETSTAVCEPNVSGDTTNGSNGHDPGVNCAAFSQFSNIHSTCTALSVIRIDSDNLSRAIADAPNMAQARVSQEQPTELKEPVALEQSEPAPEPAPAQQIENVELPTRPTSHREQQPTGSCVVGRQRLRFHAAHQTDRELVEKRVASLPSEIDLREPFERIREALEETIRSGSVR
ncbi:MAG: hypothetical protein WD648_01575 [Planctomycetaceae bacterium]